MKKNYALEREEDFILKKLLALVLIFIFAFSGCGAEKIPTDYDFTEVMEDTMAHIIEEAPNPGHNHINGEWSVIVASRYGAEVPENWHDIYYENLCNTLKENDGVLSKTKHGNYSRAVLTLTAIGRDPSDVGGYNLFDSYTDYEFVTHQGIPGSVFALLSLGRQRFLLSIQRDDLLFSKGRY